MTIKISINPRSWFSFDAESWRKGFSEGVRGAFRDRRRALSTSLAGLTAFLITVFSANPGYSVQMLFSGVRQWPIAFVTRFSGLIMNTGYTGLFLTLAFSALVGVSLTNTVVQLKMNKLDISSLGALPGFLAGGCASCGVGVLSLLGFGGVLASMPFQGNLLRLGGVILLLALITRTGNPDTCKL